jgi:hypothetical protein
MSIRAGFGAAPSNLTTPARDAGASAGLAAAAEIHPADNDARMATVMQIMYDFGFILTLALFSSTREVCAFQRSFPPSLFFVLTVHFCL